MSNSASGPTFPGASRTGPPGGTRFAVARAYLSIRPGNLGDAFRLYLALAIALMVKGLAPKRFLTSGAYLVGTAPLKIRIGKLSVCVRPHSEDLAILLMTHEPEVSGWFRPGPGELVVDVGANVGCYALRAAAAGATVIAIEPNPENYRLLVENFRLNGFTNVVALQTGAGERAGEAILTSPSIFTGRASTSRLQSGSQVTIGIKPLDDLLQIDQVRHIDWLKIDVEGSELSVLRGAPRSLTRTQNLIIEVNRRNASECRDLLLASGGFRLTKWSPDEDFDYWFLTRTPSGSVP